MRQIARRLMHDHGMRMLPMLMGAAMFGIIAATVQTGG
jgi:hypothetical protein